MILNAFKDTNVFVPDFEYGDIKNVDLPENEQVRVKIKYPNYGERRKIQQLAIFRGSDKVAVDQDAKYILETFVIEIENLEYRLENGKTARIRNGSDINKSSHKFVSLIGDLIVAEIMNPSDEEQEILEDKEEVKKSSK